MASDSFMLDPAVQRGLIWLGTAVGIHLSPDEALLLVNLGFAIAGVSPLVQRLAAVVLARRMHKGM